MSKHAYLKESDQFVMRNANTVMVCTIVGQITHFADIPHYPVNWTHPETGIIQCGWIPCLFVNDFCEKIKE